MLKTPSFKNYYRDCLLNAMSLTVVMLLIRIFWYNKYRLPLTGKWYFNIL